MSIAPAKQRQLAADFVEGDFDHPPPLGIDQQRPFAGRSAHENAVYARVDQPAQNLAKRRLIDVLLLIDGRDHGNDHAMQFSDGSCSILLDC